VPLDLVNMFAHPGFRIADSSVGLKLEIDKLLAWPPSQEDYA
jgi:hypothetical protein